MADHDHPKGIVLTGIKPSGMPHLGNYLGMIRPAIALSEDYRAFYFIADLHALTTVTDPDLLSRLSYEAAATFIALGLDPSKAILYRQSDLPEVAELSWILSCVAPKGLLNRAHAYKAATDGNRASGRDPDHGISAGLFNYPVLMAADILLLHTDVVPVGLDQKQHLEIARDLAESFNSAFGPILKVPQPVIAPDVATVPGIDGRKMSKSYDNVIPLFGDTDVIRKNVMRIVTDSRSPDEPKDPDAYWNNVTHDVTYRYGFDEAAGNFQTNNYGRGGTAGDYVRAQAASGGGTNNAVFSTPVETPASGGAPRMINLLWPGAQFGRPNEVVVDGVGTFGAQFARFSPAPTVAGLPGQRIVYASTGCDAGLYPDPLPASNWAVIVDGGTAACSYLQRVQVAEALGANAVIVAHNTTAAPPILSSPLVGTPAGIPAVGISQADGNAIKAAVAAGPTTANVRKAPDHPGIRDGDLENGIIIHEYGHGISNHLTGGPTVNCLTGNEQAGEGWSDHLAITMLLDPALDDPEGPRGTARYALFQDGRQGTSIRPRPYSRNMAIQPFTYDSIKTGGWLEGARWRSRTGSATAGPRCCGT
ncbi:MAG: tryptophan--tRNA ligase [Micromonosporaceae bacterium]|nr:tryptophan--tRNA ligase [Micromonosporaceae bacterium]